MSRIAQFLIFFGLVTVVMGSIHWYLWTRFVRDLELVTPWRQLATGAMIAMLILLIATPLTYRLLDRTVPPVFVTLVYAWMGFVTIALTIVGGLDIARFVTRHITGPVDESKRLMFARALGGAAILGAIGASAMAAKGALGSPRLRNVTVTLKRLPDAFDKLKLVQISDLHVGPTIKRDYVQDVVDKTNALNPDIIVITGDLVDGTVESLKDDVAPIGQLKARLGVFFVTGNHEYYSGVGGWLKHLPTLGVQVLSNANAKLGENLYVAGVDDWTASPDLPKALADIPEGAEVILLAHQPKQIFEAAKLKVGLVLSGHTHGGQIWPFGLLVRLAQPYVAGLADHEGTQIYVSRGTGFWGPPMRFGAPSELTHIELRAA